MRSYIFSDRERRALRGWLEEGKRLPGLAMTLYRIRIFDEIEDDIRLYQRAKERMRKKRSSQPSSSPLSRSSG